MQRQRGELGPIGDALTDLPGPVQPIRDASPQALHHFTQADQVNLLVSASEADADLGFMERMLALCSLPRTNPGNRLQYKRANGPYTLYMTAGGGNKLPYGNLPRLILAWTSISTSGSHLSHLRPPLRLTWRHLYRQFGTDPTKASDKFIVRNFRQNVLRELKKIKLAWLGLNYATAPGALILLPSTPAILPSASSSRAASREIPKQGAHG